MPSFRKICRTLQIALMFYGVLFQARSLGADAGVLTRVAEIRALSRSEAAKALPVRLKGVVVWQYASGDGLILNDGSHGIYVAINQSLFPKGHDMPMSDFELGAAVELEGVTDPGGYAPIIHLTALRREGTDRLPEPRRIRLERLLSGAEDCQSVEIEGVVHAVSKSPDEPGVTLRMKVDGYPCQVVLQQGLEMGGKDLVDARVRVRGALTSIPNLRAQSTQLRILTMGRGDIDVLKPAPEPFAGPRVTLKSLLPFSPDADPFHRKVTQGIVTFAMPGEFFLQDGETGVRVQSDEASPPLGERVEVTGFVEISRALASLSGGLVRSLGRGEMPAPAAVTPERILHPDIRAPWERVAEEDYSGRLVRLSGRILRVEHEEKENRISMLIVAGNDTFAAVIPRFPGSKGGLAGKWEMGSEVELTGVCELTFVEDSALATPLSISGFRLWMRSPDDVWVVRAAPWWTPLRLQIGLYGSGFVILLGLAWIYLLRRLLLRRTARLEEVMRGHRDVELEFASAQRERLRLAGDLHDGIKQRLAAASFRVEAALGHLPQSPDIATSQLEIAHNTLLRTQTELVECLWGLHAVAEGPVDFANLLRHVTTNSEHWPHGAFVIESEGTPRQLSRDVAGNLLLLFQEAANNALLHGAASRIDATVIYGPDFLELSVVDNGTGFDPRTAPGPRAGHFGIDGMKQRMHWLHGTLGIMREANGGMKILARLPWSSMALAEEEVADNRRTSR